MGPQSWGMQSYSQCCLAKPWRKIFGSEECALDFPRRPQKDYQGKVECRRILSSSRMTHKSSVFLWGIQRIRGIRSATITG
jgi:hypothetical protein